MVVLSWHIYPITLYISQIQYDVKDISERPEMSARDRLCCPHIRSKIARYLRTPLFEGEYINPLPPRILNTPICTDTLSRTIFRGFPRQQTLYQVFHYHGMFYVPQHPPFGVVLPDIHDMIPGVTVFPALFWREVF